MVVNAHPSSAFDSLEPELEALRKIPPVPNRAKLAQWRWCATVLTNCDSSLLMKVLFQIMPILRTHTEFKWTDLFSPGNDHRLGTNALLVQRPSRRAVANGAFVVSDHLFMLDTLNPDHLLILCQHYQLFMKRCARSVCHDQVRVSPSRPYGLVKRDLIYSPAHREHNGKQRLLMTNIKNMDGFVGRIQNVVTTRAAQVQAYHEQFSQGKDNDAQAFLVHANH